jgi:hypothetical protein
MVTTLAEAAEFPTENKTVSVAAEGSTIQFAGD